ncbi:F0F1 ATP synthase subunit delta [Desertibacillus haloalkaliphilus]|uniref:F0F1 ATP synthase subunit delta n=1 Tax=Desertibacillus haloalkaliphilus TaxID=1328930 RepID=UPI001C2677D0|nr:F0F1 ATP synthase subunit delta [Desertibacillus haloalkaliphilus]MBU8905887.1 F0F1 ATP synthase subunit delta [Desertibacillus haloalkaliphilus]
MSNHAVANRYAVALFQLAKERGQLEPISEELQQVKEVVESTPELEQLLEHPKVTSQKKKNLIQDTLASGLSESVVNTLLLLIERGRINIILPLIDKYQQLANDERGIANATIYSVKPLTEEEKNQFSQGFAKKIGKNTLYVENIIDQDLIGGVKIRIGDRIFDGSVKRQLDRLERQLISGKR